MRKIYYKETILDDYQLYVDIGSCEKHYDFLPLYDEDENGSFLQIYTHVFNDQFFF